MEISLDCLRSFQEHAGSFRQLHIRVSGPFAGFHGLPIAVHLALREIWDAGLAELDDYPEIADGLRNGRIALSAVSRLWWLLIEYYVRFMLARISGEEMAWTGPIFVIGETQVSKTILVPLMAVMLTVVSRGPERVGVSNVMVVPGGSIAQIAQVAKMAGQLRHVDPDVRPPTVRAVPGSRGFADDYPRLCSDTIYVAQSNYHQIDNIIEGIKNTLEYRNDKYMYLVQLDEADTLIGTTDKIRYHRSLEVLCGRPGEDEPQLPLPIVVNITATFVPLLLRYHDELDTDFDAEDFVWLEPGTNYSSPWDLCRPVTDDQGAPLYAEQQLASTDNFYILFDAGKKWLRDLASTPHGYGLAACNDKVTAAGGIESAAAGIRDAFYNQLTVVGISGGNRMFVAYHDDLKGTPARERKRGKSYEPQDPLEDELVADRDWRQMGTHLLEVHRRIGATSLLVIGMTSLIRLHTYSIFSGDGLIEPDRGVIERPVSHSYTLLGPGRTCEDYHHARGRVAGYHRQALMSITGRDYVLELTSENDKMAIDRWPVWRDTFRARLEAGQNSREAMAVFPAKDFYITPFRAGLGRTSSARPICKRKFPYKPRLEGEDSDVEELKARPVRRFSERRFRITTVENAVFAVGKLGELANGGASWDQAALHPQLQEILRARHHTAFLLARDHGFVTYLTINGHPTRDIQPRFGLTNSGALVYDRVKGVCERLLSA